LAVFTSSSILSENSEGTVTAVRSGGESIIPRRYWLYRDEISPSPSVSVHAAILGIGETLVILALIAEGAKDREAKRGSNFWIRERITLLGT
tara:strand:+ start:365 stop:640 length:276 start_codon:yes stop_codon:yes gene_type:complete